MTQYIDKNTLIAEIERRIKTLYPKGGQGVVVTKILKDHYEDMLSYLDTLEVKEVQEESVSDDLEKAARKYLKSLNDDCFISSDIIRAFKTGAQWEKEVKEVDFEDTIDETKDEAMRDMAWKVHVMISEGKSISEIDNYVCWICDF